MQDDLNFKETEMHKSQSTAVSLDSGETYCLDLFFFNFCLLFLVF